MGKEHNWILGLELEVLRNCIQLEVRIFASDGLDRHVEFSHALSQPQLLMFLPPYQECLPFLLLVAKPPLDTDIVAIQLVIVGKRGCEAGGDGGSGGNTG